MTAYCISGLGADETLFDFLNLQCEMKFITWEPANQWESLNNYAHRLCDQVDTSTPYMLIGVSFGGMVAVEMNKHLNPQATILITSVARRSELPAWIRSIAITRVNRVLPTFFYSAHSIWLIWLFGIKSESGRKLMKTLAAKNDKTLTKLTIDMILTWQNEWLPENLLRIHAERDYMLPPPVDDNAVEIESAGHFAVVENAEEVSSIINRHLSRLNIDNKI